MFSIQFYKSFASVYILNDLNAFRIKTNIESCIWLERRQLQPITIYKDIGNFLMNFEMSRNPFNIGGKKTNKNIT